MSNIFSFKSPLTEHNIKGDRNRLLKMQIWGFLSRDGVKTFWQQINKVFKPLDKTTREKSGQGRQGEKREKGRQVGTIAFIGGEQRWPPVTMVNIKTMKRRLSSWHSYTWLLKRLARTEFVFLLYWTCILHNTSLLLFRCVWLLIPVFTVFSVRVLYLPTLTESFYTFILHV